MLTSYQTLVVLHNLNNHTHQKPGIMNFKITAKSRRQKSDFKTIRQLPCLKGHSREYKKKDYFGLNYYLRSSYTDFVIRLEEKGVL